MLIYILLIVYILILPYIVSPFVRGDNVKIQKYTALFGMIAVFLLLALKAPSVGVDIKGYEQQYYLSRRIPWNDFSYVYYENGYILFEKIFSKLGLSFQFFTAFIYFLECLSVYLIISKYSTDSRFSILFFVCYQFLVFSTSGLRQTIAVSLCTFAFLLFYKQKLLPSIFGLLLTAAAYTVHSSALIFFVIPVIILLNRYFSVISLSELIIGVVLSLFIRSTLWSFINNYFRKIESDGGFSLSGNFIFLLCIALFCLFTYQMYYRTGLFGRRTLYTGTETVTREPNDTFLVRASICIVLMHIMLSGGVLLRGLMCLNMMLVAFLPNMINKYRFKQKAAIKAVFMTALILIFYFQTLSVNQLGICPYKFFWEGI